jgi:hypothetical protein
VAHNPTTIVKTPDPNQLSHFQLDWFGQVVWGRQLGLGHCQMSAIKGPMSAEGHAAFPSANAKAQSDFLQVNSFAPPMTEKDPR